VDELLFGFEKSLSPLLSNGGCCFSGKYAHIYFLYLIYAQYFHLDSLFSNHIKHAPQIHIKTTVLDMNIDTNIWQCRKR
jgi:hypothetical protein